MTQWQNIHLISGSWAKLLYWLKERSRLQVPNISDDTNLNELNLCASNDSCGTTFERLSTDGSSMQNWNKIACLLTILQDWFWLHEVNRESDGNGWTKNSIPVKNISNKLFLCYNQLKASNQELMPKVPLHEWNGQWIFL